MTFEEDIKELVIDCMSSGCDEEVVMMNLNRIIEAHKSKVREVILSNTYQIENRDKILKELGLTSEDKE